MATMNFINVEEPYTASVTEWNGKFFGRWAHTNGYTYWNKEFDSLADFKDALLGCAASSGWQLVA